MEGKVLLQDLAQSFAAKRKMQRKDAEAFLKAFFETISEGILQDKIVKIKGLGTFKMIEVQDRESVNVNTGERILIPGHSKISFTPDSELKDEVNKPFALFQTVIINEGTSIEDMERVDKVESVELKDERVEEVSVESVESVVPAATEGKDIQESPVSPEVPESSEITETPVVSEVPTKPAEEQPGLVESQPTTAIKRSWWYVGPAMTALLFAFFWIVLLIGYFIGSNNWVKFDDIISKITPEPVIQVDTIVVEKMVEPDSVYIQSLEDSIRNAIQEEGKVTKPQPKVVAPQPEKTQEKPIAANKKKSVAYEIVGYKGMRTIQWGDYLLKIVRQEYGTEDVLKYVVAYNNFINPNNLPVGTEVKLPKLKEK